MARRRFFVSEFRNHRAELMGDEAHHLTRVLRVERGQQYEVSDNRTAFLATVTEAHKSKVVFELAEPVPPRPQPVSIELCVALVKFDRIEWILEKCTELGVARFRLFAASRSEKGLDQGAAKRLSRWEKIIVESSQQCRRDHLPTLEAPAKLDAVWREGARLRFFLDEEPGAEHLLAQLPAPAAPGQAVSLLVGPEGGWEAGERRAALDQGWIPASLGPQVLRTETAAMAACAVVQAHWFGAAQNSLG
jgi:16S rRNA (uracil1498-N3)-methyltransferase